MITQVPLADAVQIFGVTLVGVSTTTAVKLAFTLAFFAVVTALRSLALAATRRLLGGEVADQRRFWARQGIHVVVAVVLVIGIVSIWVTPTTDITTGVGLISAGLAFALQQVITSLAAYFVILRGDTFGVGDRITLGGVRGDVIRLGFLKTTIMEMGQPPSVADTDPAVWVNSRQYTARWRTCPRGVSAPTPPWCCARRSRTTCCVPPEHWPVPPTPSHAEPPCPQDRQRRGPIGSPATPTRPAPTQPLALGERMAQPVAQHHRPTPTATARDGLTTRRKARPEPTGKAGQTSGPATPTISDPPPNQLTPRRQPHPRIEA